MPLNKIQQQMLDQQVQDKLNAVGNKADLKTTNKTDLVAAINENSTLLAEKATKTEVTEIEGSIVYAEQFYRDFSETDDTGRLQRMINAAGSTGRVKFNKPKSVYIISSSLIITNPEVVLFSDFKSEYAPKIKCTTPNVTMIKVKNYGFGMYSVILEGDAVIENPFTGGTVTGIEIDRSDGTGAETLSNLDAEIQYCGFQYLKDAVIANGRNVFFFYNIFSICLRGVTIKRYPNAQCRGNRFENNRFHAMGSNDFALPAGETSYCIKIDKDAYANVVINNFSDYSKDFYIGPVSRSRIDDNHLFNIFGNGIYITPHASQLDANMEYGWSVKGNKILSELYTTYSDAQLQSLVTMGYGIYSESGNLQHGIIAENIISQSRKTGIHLTWAQNVEIHDNLIINPNKYAKVDGIIYDGIYIGAGGYNNRVRDNRLRSTVPYSVKPRYGINNDSGGTEVYGNKIENFSTEIYNNQTSAIIKTKGTAPPTDRGWGVGSVIENTAPAAGGYLGWVCVVSGYPGTWKGYGAIQA